MKRFVCFLLSLVMAATMLTGCGSQSTTGDNSTPQAEKKRKGRSCLLGKSDAG